jgi:hypothetical protein
MFIVIVMSKVAKQLSRQPNRRFLSFNVDSHFRENDKIGVTNKAPRDVVIAAKFDKKANQSCHT